LGGAHNDPDKAAEALRDCLLTHLEQLLAIPAAERLKQRYAKFRNFGSFIEKNPNALEVPEAPAPPVAISQETMVEPQAGDGAV